MTSCWEISGQPEPLRQMSWFGTSGISEVSCLYCGVPGVNFWWEVVASQVRFRNQQVRLFKCEMLLL